MVDVEDRLDIRDTAIYADDLVMLMKDKVSKKKIQVAFGRWELVVNS